MFKATSNRLLLGATALLMASSGFAQIDIQIRPRQLAGWDPRVREGRCEIHVWVDNHAEVRMRGDAISVRTLEGAKSHDEGSECSQPLPYNSVRGFQIRQSTGRNPVTLAQEPSRMNNYTALMSIDDRQGGGDNYSFEVTWRSEGDGANRPAAFFDDVRACQDLVRQRYLTQNGRNSYVDFDNFADRQSLNQNRGQGRGQNGKGDQESIQGRGRARSSNESRELTYSCIVDTQRSQVVSGDYQFSGSRSNTDQRNRSR